MEKSLYSNPAIIFSGNTAKRIFDKPKPKKNIQTEIKRQKSNLDFTIIYKRRRNVKNKLLYRIVTENYF